MAASSESGFHISPFGLDGEQVGIGYWQISKLSDLWLGVCRKFLEANGAVFDASWAGNLSEIRTKFTSALGAAISTFYVRGRVASSLLFLNGHAVEAEHAVIEMFVGSLRATELVRIATATRLPFSAIASLRERPLVVAVAWPDSTISDHEQEIVRELGLHLAGAFFA